jgi:hypothetical protein
VLVLQLLSKQNVYNSDDIITSFFYGYNGIMIRLCTCKYGQRFNMGKISQIMENHETFLGVHLYIK